MLLPWLPNARDSQTQVTTVPDSEPGIGKTSTAVQKSSAISRPTQTLNPKRKIKDKPSFSVSPKLALAIVGAGLGLAFITIFLILVTGSPKEQGSISVVNQPFQPSGRPGTDLINYVSKSPRKDVVEGNCVYLDLRTVANVISTKHIFIPEESQTVTNSIPLSTWGRSNYHGVPFELIDPLGKTVPNILVFGGGDTPFTKNRRTVASLSCNTNAKVIHILGGISGWAYPHITVRNVILVARVHYKNGQTEEHKLYNGTHFADWKMPHGNVPAAPVVLQMDSERHLRYFSIEPMSREEIDRIEFIKGENQSAAPIFFAITVEKP